MADKKYGKLSAPKKDETMEEDFEAEMLEGLEDEEMSDSEGMEEPASDIATALAGFSKEEIEEYLATMDEEDMDMEEEEFSEPQMIMGDS